MSDKVLSQESGVAPYETFFHDFEFEAFTFFNYWTDDEAVNDKLELEDRDINDMPRFVKLVWSQAPDLPEEKEAHDKITPPSKVRTSAMPPTADSGEQFIVEGVEYSPEQLRPKDFSKISTSLANADIAPGVIQSVVSLPLITSGFMGRSPLYRIDLDSWYENDKSRGVHIGDIRNSFGNRSSGFFNLPSIYKAGVSAKNSAAFSELFKGQFAVTPSSFVRSKSTISSATSQGSALGLRSATAKGDSVVPTHPAENIFNEITYDRLPANTNSVRVGFVDTGVGNVVSQDRLNAAEDASHANSISAVAQVMKNLISYSESGIQNAKRKITLRSFDAPNGLSSKEYVGYLIEKYEQVAGVFQLKELIGIGDPYVDEFYDTKVRYGGVYRYRIRSVIRWVHPKHIGANGTDNTIHSITTTDNANQSTSSTTLTPNFATYFGSEWSKNWATAHVIDEVPANPPDQLSLLPQSEKNRVIVSFQLPENSQRDIWQMTLYRRVIDKDAREVIPWTELADFDMSAPGYYEDTNFVIPSKGSKPFRYIYAATSWSVHNGESKLSEQLGARLNPEWKDRGEHPVEFFSSRGVDRIADHGVFSTNPVKMYKTHMVATPLNSFNKREQTEIHLKGQERWATRTINSNKFILRMHSLDTGEFYDVDFNTSMVSLDANKVEVPSNIYIPSANEQYVYDDSALTSG